MASNDNTVAVYITGDASGVQPAVEVAQGSLSGLAEAVQALSAQMASMSAEIKSSMAGVSEAIAGARTSVRELHEEASTGFTGMIGKIHEGAESIRTFQARAREFAEVYASIFLVESIARWAEALGEAAHKVEMLSAQTGMTAGQIQALSGAATMSGTNIDVLAKGLAMLDNRAVTASTGSSAASQAFKAMGISANDGTSNMDRLLKVADQFHGMADGPQKTALAMQLFGKSGREMIPFLNQGAASIDQLMEKTKELGGEDEKSVEIGAALASSVNESKVAWEGLKNVLTDAFGPLLTEIVDGFIGLVKAMKDSYDSGGLVKEIFDSIGEVVSGLIEIFQAVGQGIEEVFSSTSSSGVDWAQNVKAAVDLVVVAFKAAILAVVFMDDAFVAAFDLIKAACSAMAANIRETWGGIQADGIALGDFMRTVGRVIEDAMHLNWGSIQADWDQGLETLRKDVAAKAQQITAITGAMRQQAQADMAAALGVGSSFKQFYSNLDQGSGAPKHDGFNFKFGGGGGEAPELGGGKGKKGPKDKAGKDDAVQELEEELEAKKAAWEAEQIAQGTAQEYSLESEAKFWADALARTDLSAKDKLAIQKKWIEAEKKLEADGWEQKVAGYQRDLIAAGQNATAKLAILKQEQAATVAMYGANSKEARAAAKQVEDAEREVLKQHREIEAEKELATKAAALAQIDAAAAAADFEVETGRMSAAKRLEMEHGFEDQRYQIEMQGLQKRLQLMRLDPGHDPVGYQKLLTQIEQLETQHQTKLTQIDQKAALERTKIERDAMNSLAQGWAQNLAKMATLQQSFSTTLKGLWQSIQEAVAQVIEGILEKFIAAQLVKLGLVKTEAVSTVGAESAKAGAAGVASMAAAPWPLDMTAPAFGASMSAAAASFGSIGSFDVGAWNLSKDQLALVHGGEMIIPAGLADGMRGLFQAAGNDNSPMFGGSSGSGSAGGTGGDVHLHFNGPTDRRGIERWFSDNRNGVRAGVMAVARKGGAATLARA